MNDFDRRLSEVESQLRAMGRMQYDESGVSGSIQNSSMDLIALWNQVWFRKYWIIGITLIVCTVGATYIMSLPNVYRAEGVYVATSTKTGAGLISQYGGLAAMAGLNLSGGDSTDLDQAIVYITSRHFLEGVIEKNNLKPHLLAVKGWDSSTDRLLWDDAVFDEEKNVFLIGAGESERSKYKAYKNLRDKISVYRDKRTNLITISVSDYSPSVAKDWVVLIVDALNSYFKDRAIERSERSIKYLTQKIDETSITEMQKVFYGMIEGELKSLMLAEVNDEYLLETVIPVKVPEERSSPNRIVLIIISIMLGGFIALVIVFIDYFIRKTY